MNILIIDDEEFFVENLARYLEKSIPAQINYIAKADDALRILKQKQFELIICDLNLPDQSEGELIMSIHRINPTQKFIVVSAKSEQEMPECLKDIRQRNIIRFFEKPFNIESIKDVIVAFSEKKMKKSIDA